jgi:conjugative relaxase-like TrwC/TraI family protein
MLRIIQNRAAAQAKSYYAHSDYLSESQELTGRWSGRSAQMMGLSGDVLKEHFDRLCDNLHPQSGQQLTLRTDSDRTTGYDFNFHLPKGVSLAYSMGKDERILEAFRESVDETMREVEEDSSTRVRKHGMDGNRHTGNLAWATFIHKTARPVEGEPDPHLHAHAFCFNSTWDQKEQAWKAVQFRDIKRDAPYYEAAFHARMAMRMRGLGYEIRRKGRDWDLAAVPEDICRKFSRRKDQIEELARELGIDDAADKDQLGAKSREKKASGLGMDELRRLWATRLTEDERDVLDSLKQQAAVGLEMESAVERDAASMLHASEHCFERQSVVPERKLLTEALRHGVGHVTVDGMRRQLDTHRIIRREVEGRMMATSLKVLKEEQSMLLFAKEGVGTEQPLNANWNVQQQWLNPDQQNAVQHVLNSTDRLMIIKGGAGTGKTSLMRETVNGIEATGRKVFTFAPSSEASRGVLRAEGFEATTVAELLVNRELQQKVVGNVIWVDEAGLLGSRTMKRLFDIAQEQHSRVVLSGDWRQHGSVERGAAMRLLEQQAGIRPAVVRKIQRQDGAYRDAVALLADGYTLEGFQALQKMGWVKEIDDEGDRYRLIAKDYADILHRGETVLATAPTHAESDLLTAAIREELLRRGMVAKESHAITQLKPLYLTTAEKADGERIAEGDVIVFTQNAKGYQRGQRLKVRDGLPANLKEIAGRFEVFRQQEIQLAKGDMIRITGGGKSKEGRRLDSGTFFQLTGFTEHGDMRLNNGWVVARDYGFISTGYSSTSHSSQGKTVKHVLVAESSVSYPAAGQQQFYVSISRGQKSATVYTDKAMGLAEAILKSDARMSASELLAGTPAETVRRTARAKAIGTARQQPPRIAKEQVYEQP